MDGKFIVFEGGEGSGKSSHVQLTSDFLTQRGFTTLATHEPGATAVGKIIRRLILDHAEEATTEPLAARAELMLFLADRAQHVAEQIQPAMQRGTSVLCDRFTGSTLAYQVGARNLGPEALIEQMEAFARAGLEPDLTIYLDLDPTIGIARKQRQANHTMNTFDQFDVEFHQAVRDYFLRYAHNHPQWVVLDANRPLTAVQFDINQLLDKLYGTTH
ncbi:MAG: dTMP kinase [Candidatus Kerfeldbacteria bacterium]|nr:dTMP kinase [Candidatus Kerfeldbacteria bacterium]